MSKNLDVILFGVTGFTGKYVLIQAHKLFKNISWGVAGRNESKLRERLRETAKIANESNYESIPVMYANTEDEQTIKAMTNKAKVLVTCGGPYDMNNGEIVVKCCIETGTHYIDVSAEELFITSIILKYQKLAEEKGIYIVNMCGFDSVPFDLGVCFMEKEFDGTLNSVEVYAHSPRDSRFTAGPSLNNSTWRSIINGLTQYKKIMHMKKQLKGKDKKIDLKPKLTTKLPHKVKYGVAMPFPGADEQAVHRSQLYFYEENGKRPVQFRTYAIMESMYSIVVTIVLALICFILAQLAIGRKFLLRYPQYFSNGTFGSGSPSDDSLTTRNCSLIMKGKGWSNKQSNSNGQFNTQPNKEIVGCITGSNPAYGITALSVVLCALVTLLEPTKLPTRGGIYTPAAAFSKTSLIEKLQKNGVTFEIISRAD